MRRPWLQCPNACKLRQEFRLRQALRQALRLYMDAFAGMPAAGVAATEAADVAAAGATILSKASKAKAAELASAKAVEDEFVAVTLAAIGRDGGVRALRPQLSDATAAEKAVLEQIARAGDRGVPLLDWRAREAVPPRLIAAGVLDMDSPSTYEPTVLRFTSPAMRAMHSPSRFPVPVWQLAPEPPAGHRQAPIAPAAALGQLAALDEPT